MTRGDMIRGDSPIAGRLAAAYGELLAIVTHPSFRLGFLDAMAGRPIDHDRIFERIRVETPPRALDRIGWGRTLLSVSDLAVEVAQYRYEEGRLLALAGVRCRAWGHPDYPPVAVERYIRAAVRERVAP